MTSGVARIGADSQDIISPPFGGSITRGDVPQGVALGYLMAPLPGLQTDRFSFTTAHRL